ncbi:iron-containing alcohol dehydrogenase, partial [Myxococcota bacterium]|nr:iron-containing alcohol dehydrogenase [Myxococcota bacterium]
EISALTDLAHARTLACVLIPMLRHQAHAKQEKLIAYGAAVFGHRITDARQAAAAAIDATEAFFHSLGVSTKLRDYLPAPDVLEEIPHRFSRRGMLLGERGDITPPQVKEILDHAW